jgi:hypothetical protein
MIFSVFASAGLKIIFLAKRSGSCGDISNYWSLKMYNNTKYILNKMQKTAQNSIAFNLV